jgi:aquaporin Z
VNGNAVAAKRQVPSGRAEKADWKATVQQHWPEYLMEGAELGTFMISACFFTVLLEHPSSPLHQLMPNGGVRRGLMGVAMGTTLVAIVHSGWGKQSGAHMNPAFTLAFWRLKKISTTDAVFYVMAQFAGGIAGVLAAMLVLREKVMHPAVRYAATLPGSEGVRVAFAAEVLISFLLLLTVLMVSNQKALARYTPLFAGTLVAIYITFEAPFSGMSMNPARTLGSAFFPRVWTALWIYFTAPPLGMLLATEVFRRLDIAQVHCAKYHHTNSKRCIFNCAFHELMK